jgi:hypothetical protein
MLISYSPVSLGVIFLVVLLAMFAAPMAVNGAGVFEAGKHRVWWTRKGWTYDYDRMTAGTYFPQTVSGVVIAKSTYWSKGGFWPWVSRS